MAQLTIQNAFDLAAQHHRAGRLNQAEQLYRQILAQAPQFLPAVNGLAVLAQQVGRADIAVEFLKQVTTHRPGDAAGWSNLGNALKDAGRLDEAIAAYRQAIALSPELPEAHSNLGNVLQEKGVLDEAIAACRKAIALRADLPEAHGNLGNALKRSGQIDEAIAEYRLAIALRPSYARAHCNLGIALRDTGQLGEAIASYRRAIALNPKYADALNNFGIALRDKGELDEAVAMYRRAIELKPDFPEAYSNLGNVLKELGQLDEALAAYRKAMTLNPQSAEAHGNLAYTLLFHPAYDARAIAEEHRRWNQQHALPLGQTVQPHPDDRDPDRRLRIGYVSPDLRDHVVGRNVLPLIREHDRDHFEIFCYADVIRPDFLTALFQDYASHWRNIVGFSDEQVARQIQDDRIDILIDLTLHMAHNRLRVFARKPAPVQVSFAGYPGAAGLDAIDYRLTDPFLDPRDSAENLYPEQPVHLPETFWCYDPAAMMAGIDPEPLPGPLPALASGIVTFGCLNNFGKVNEPVLKLWARVLNSVPNSRLMLLAPVGSARQRVLHSLGGEGIASSRIEFVANAPRSEYLRRYRGIDIGLDTFPYNGHTTSLDALWMGVPVITKVGQTIVGRAGLSQLSNLGMTELVAGSEDEFVQIATDLAGDLNRLAEVRENLRQRMRQSSLTDAERFKRNVETCYRKMWRNWCARDETIC